MVEGKSIQFGDLFETKINRKHVLGEEKVTFIGMEDVSEDGQLINQNITNYSEVKKGLTYFEKDDVLIAKITPCFENSKGACLDKLKTEKGFGSTEFHVLRAKANVEPRYIYYHTQLKKFRKQLEREMIGSAGQRRIPIKSIISYPLSMRHTLSEQKAIAEVLSDMDKLIAAIEKLIDKKQKIKQGTMQLLLTGKKRLPGFTGEWEVKRLVEIFSFLRTGTNSRSDLIEEGNIQYIHYGDIHTKWDSILDCSVAQIPYIEEKKVKDLPLLKEGDLIMVDASEDYEGLGKSIEIKNIGEQKVVAGLHTILLRGNKELVADGFKGYIQFIKAVNDSLYSIATGISVYGISKRNLQDIRIPLPPLPEQRAIAQILSDMDAEIEALEKKLEKYRLIKAGMMEKLLTGEVRLV